MTLNSQNSYALDPDEKKIVRLAALGGMLEFYDFIIYGIFSVYFASQFFPGDNQILSTIKSYVIFIFGYIARPLGGLLFSHLGDEYGRKHVLVITIGMMGLSTLGIGLLPTYEQIGIFAPLGLLLLRLVQGLALGGELPSTYVYVSESMPKKIGSGFAITMVGVNAGLLLGMVMNQCLTMLFSETELRSFGWRIPFIFGGIICSISYQIRKSLHETTAFESIHNRSAFPFFHLIRHHFPEVLIGISITAIMSALVMVAIVFMPTYLDTFLHLEPTSISQGMILAMVCNLIAIYATGMATNRINPRTILAYLLLFSVPLVPYSFWLISENHWLVGLVLLSILEGIAALLIPMLICGFFTTSIRLTGVAFCYNIGFTLFGGLAPVIISQFINMGYSVYLTPIVYLLVVVAVCGIGLIASNRVIKNVTE